MSNNDKTVEETSMQELAEDLEQTMVPEDPIERAKKIKKQAKTIRTLREALGKAQEVVSGFQEERTVADESERQQLIYNISKDSRGYLRKDQLAPLSIYDLRLIRKNFEDESSRDYLTYFERRRAEELAGQRKTGATVGEWDPKTKTWKA